MKVGAEDKKKMYIMGALLAVALLLMIRTLFFSGDAPAASANATASPSAAARATKGANATLDPTLRTDLLKNSEVAEYRGTGRNIFEPQATPLPQPKHPVVVTPPPVVAQGPPPPPPIPLKFFGFANNPGEPKSIFLAQGEDVFIGHEGEIVNRRYKIVHIGSNAVEIEDVMNNNRQSIPLTQG
jgi:hypothetical protein